jgi:hypothetical protein
MPFSDFLAALFRALKAGGVRFCVLRNYEGFPENNIGSDVDFLIDPRSLPGAIRALHSIPGIRVTGYSERSWVAHAFVEGVSPAPGIRALQVDFLWLLNWKGQPYLLTDAVLEAAIPRQAGSLEFLVPSPVHEAISSLFASLLVGGWLKEKYYPRVRQTFTAQRTEAITSLSPQFGVKISTRVVDSIIGGDRQKLLDCIRPLRRTLLLRNLLHKHFRCILAAGRYYVGELVVDYSPEVLETVCVMGADGCGKAEIIAKLMPLLEYSAKFVEKRDLRPRVSFGPTSLQVASSVDLLSQAPNGSAISVASVALWLLEEWLGQFTNKRNLTLSLRQSYYQDLAVNPHRFRYGGPKWFVRFAGKLAPSPDLWILLDPGSKESESKKQLPAEMLRQLEAYRAFVKTRKRYIVLDANLPLDDLVNRAYDAIINALEQITYDRKLKGRVSSLSSAHPAVETAARS